MTPGARGLTCVVGFLVLTFVIALLVIGKEAVKRAMFDLGDDEEENDGRS